MKGLILILSLILGLQDASIASGQSDDKVWSDCGSRPQVVSTISAVKRIIGGQESNQGSWPWMISLRMNSTQWCGASLIHSEWIVTAAHCFHEDFTSTNPLYWTATMGDHHLLNTDTYEEIIPFKNIIVHPKFNWTKVIDKVLIMPPEYDIALVKLERPASLNDYVTPVCLKHRGIRFFPQEECHVTGWGHTSYGGNQSVYLQEAIVELVSRETCNSKESYNGMVHNMSLCAGYKEGGVDACNYDSGGPLVCEIGDRYYLHGMVSWGHYCAYPHKYGVYTNVDYFLPWIKETIKKKISNHGD